MRADRLIATLLVLQARGRVTAGELADELEVSVATARRGLEALLAAGVPVYPQAGRGGGWSLVGGARTDLTGLTAPEAEALFLLAGPVAGVSDEAKVLCANSFRRCPRRSGPPPRPPPRPQWSTPPAGASASVLALRSWACCRAPSCADAGCGSPTPAAPAGTASE